MTVATDLREVYGPNAAKKIARDFGVAVITAKVWLAGRFRETNSAPRSGADGQAGERVKRAALWLADLLSRIARRLTEWAGR